jgi:hypothetical protein
MDAAALVAAVTLAMVYPSGPRELAQEQGAASIHNPKPEMGEMGDLDQGPGFSTNPFTYRVVPAGSTALNESLACDCTGTKSEESEEGCLYGNSNHESTCCRSDIN